ncbi:MAG: glycosyltransferase family 39 protein [Candidatus Roizmanbacteria bacterium]|nr:glycosyltransferase family 39 protein [Candidatus Roizmanbacteria bacterium]
MRLDILLIILGGLFLRLYRLQDFYMFLADQGRDAVIIRRIITFQKFPLIGPPSSIGEVFLGPFYYYLVAPFLWIFQSNPIGLAIGVALLSMIAATIIYFIVSKIVSKETAFLFSVFIAFSALFVDIGRFSWNPNLLPYFSFITISLFFLSLHGKRKLLYTFMFGIMFGLSFQLHHLAALLVVPITLYFFVFLFRKKDWLALKVPLISVIGFILTLAPFALFEIRHGFINMHNLFSLFTKQNVVSTGSFISRLNDVISAIIPFALHLSIHPVLSFLIVITVVGIVVFLLKKKENPFVTLQLISFISLIIALSRVNAQVIPHYFHIMYMSFYFLLAYILSTLFHSKLKVIGIIVTLLFVLIQAPSYSFFWKPASRQYELPERIGKEIALKAQGERINLTTYPVEFTSRDCYQYYIEVNGGNVIDGSSSEIAKTLYVLCDKKPCRIINSDSWNIQMFGKAKIDTMWEKDGVTIYKLIHQ